MYFNTELSTITTQNDATYQIIRGMQRLHSFALPALEFKVILTREIRHRPFKPVDE